MWGKKECFPTTLEIKQKPLPAPSEIKINPKCINERLVQNSLLFFGRTGNRVVIP